MWGGGGKKASKGADAPKAAAVKSEAKDVKMDTDMDDWPGVEPGERRILHACPLANDLVQAPASAKRKASPAKSDAEGSKEPPPTKRECHCPGLVRYQSQRDRERQAERVTTPCCS